MSRWLALTSTVVLVGLLPAVAEAEEAPQRRLAVWTSTPKPFPQPLARSVAVALGTELGRLPGWTVLEPTAEQIKALAELAPTCASDAPACWRGAASLLAVDHLLMVELSRDRGDLRMRLSLVDVPRATVLATHQGLFRKDLERTDAQLGITRLLAALPPPAAAASVAGDIPAPIEEAAADAVPAGAGGAAEMAAGGAAAPGAGVVAAGADAAVTDGGGAAAPATVAAEPWSEDEAAWVTAEPDAELLLARASLAEADGDVAAAREHLRQAQRLAPDHSAIAFALARLSVEHPQGALPADAERFLSLPAEGAAAQILAAHLRLRRGERAAAEEITRALARALPTDAEVARLTALARPPPAPAAESRLRASARVAAQADSNVSVQPDDAPTQLFGARAAAEGAIAYTPRAGAWRGDFGVRLSAAMHLNDRDALALYDVGTAAVSLRQSLDLGGLALATELAGTEVLIDAFAAQFMQEAALRAQLTGRLGAVETGGFVHVGYRDFVYANPEGELDDRDGLETRAGLLAQWRARRLTLGARAGVLVEVAQGARQDVLGGMAGLEGGVRLASVSATLGATYLLRDYSHSRRGSAGQLPHRTDHRVMPHARVAWTFLEPVALFASYLFTANLSSARYDYLRHLGQVGVEAQW